MIKWQSDLIEKTQPKLLSMVICSEVFLTYLVTPGGLTAMEKESITQLRNFNPDFGAHVGKLLTLLKTRTEGFDLFVSALNRTDQTGALKILQDNAASVGGKIPVINPVPGSETGGTTPGSDDASRSYLKLIVGSDDCTIDDIVEILEFSNSASVYQTKWGKMATKFGINQAKQDVWDEALRSRTINHFKIFNDMLYEWISAVGDDATLGKIIEIADNRTLKLTAFTQDLVRKYA